MIFLTPTRKLSIIQQNGVTELIVKEGTEILTNFYIDADLARTDIKKWLMDIGRQAKEDTTLPVVALIPAVSGGNQRIILDYKKDRAERIKLSIITGAPFPDEVFAQSVELDNLEELLEKIGRTEYGYTSYLMQAFPKLES